MTVAPQLESALWLQAPVFLSQLSIVHESPSSQAQVPLGPALAWPLWVQLPSIALQPSSVQASPSSQSFILPVQMPAAQASLLVQASLSLQAPVMGSWKQYLKSGAQLSAVHELPSSQAAIPSHLPPLQVSLMLHWRPSSQEVPSGSVTLATHLPAWQIFCDVQALLSPQGWLFLIGLNVQVPFESQLSWVQALPSLHLLTV